MNILFVLSLLDSVLGFTRITASEEPTMRHSSPFKSISIRALVMHIALITLVMVAMITSLPTGGYIG